MKHLINLMRIMKAGLLNFFRNAWLSTAATAIMIVTLTIILSTVVLNKALGDTIQDLAKDISISVYLHDDAPKKKISELGDKLKNDPTVKQVTFVSKEEAQKRFVRESEGEKQLLDSLDVVGNVFPASFELELHDLSDNNSVVSTINNSEYKDVVEKFDQDRVETVDKIGSTQNFITNMGIGAGLLFAGISILVIFNTIRMAIFTRSNEIQIMRLIGATKGYIRGPFIFEAMLYGIFGGIIAIGSTYGVLMALGPKANSHVHFTPTIEFFSANWPLVGLVTILGGMFIGVVSSQMAMMRYLRG